MRAGPELPGCELVAADGEFTHQLDRARVAGISGDLRTQHPDQFGYGGRPVRAGPVGLRVKEQSQQVPLPQRLSGELAQQGTA
nr:hypothetical protein [Streptomyces olivochromogenes]